MSIVNDKRDIFSEVGACRSLNEGFPELQIGDSFPSISNDRDPIQFLTGLLKTISGPSINGPSISGPSNGIGGLSNNPIINCILTTVSKRTGDIESIIKFLLKNALKEYVSCKVDPSLPNFLTSPGLDFRVDKIDLNNILKINPTSKAGQMLYKDPSAGLNSDDFNTFLHKTLQTGNQENWENILNVKFNQAGNPNNTINVQADSSYSKLSDFNNDYIDSIELFNSEKLLTKIMDSIFGVVSADVNFSLDQLLPEEKVKNVVENINSTEDDQQIDSSFFSFSSPEIDEQERRARNRSNGIQELINCGNVASSVSFDTTKEMHDQVKSATTKVEETKVITSKFDEISSEAGFNVPDKDKPTVELDFFDQIINNLHIAITNLILSPKVIMIFAINHKIVNGLSAAFDGVMDFMEKNKALIEDIVKEIRDIIVDCLLQEALKLINQLVQSKATAILTEKLNNQQAQLVSLFGVSQDLIRTITNLA